MIPIRTFLRTALCAAVLAPAFLHAAPLPASGGDLPVTAIDYFSEDNAPQRRGEEPGAVDHVDPLTGGLRIDIPLFSLPGPGGALNLRWTYNSLEPFTEPIRAIRVRDGMGTPSTPVFPMLELPDGTTQRFYPIDPNALKTWGYSAAGQYRTTSNWWLEKGGRGDAMTLKSPSGTVYQLSVTRLEVKKTLLSANSIQPFNAPQERPTEGRYRNLGGEFDYYLPAASTDVNGNRITYRYDGLLLRSLSAADGRSITINWQSRYPEQSQRVASVVAGTRQWLFDYADASQLRIQQPDGLSWFLPYRDWETYMTTNESNSRLNLHQYPLYTGVTLPSGGRTSFEFMRYLAPVPLPEGCTQTNCDKPASIREQPHPAVARKTTSDGGVWVYNHYADWGIDSVLATDVEAIRGDKIAPVIQGRRQVSGPGGITYYTYVSPYDVTDCQNDLWKSGLLLERSDATASGQTLQTTRYTWGYLTIAHAVSMLDSNCRSTVSRVPLQTRQTITRDGKTFTTTQEYDSYGRVIATDESGDNGDSRRTERSYLTDTSRWIIDKVTAESVRAAAGMAPVSSLSRVLDGNGNLLQETRDGISRNYTYDGAGQLATATDPRGFVTRYSDYYRGIPRGEVRPVATGSEPATCPASPAITLARSVDDYGNVVSLTDGRGYATGYQYDAMNRLTRITPPQGNPTSIAWSASGRTLTRGNYSDSISWDGFGRPLQSTVNGITISRQFDALGRQTFESYPNQSVGDSTYYDALNRVTQLTHSDGTYRSFGYSGSAVAEVNERGYQTSSFYQVFGNPDDKALRKVVPPIAAATTDIQRDLLGKVTQVTQNGVTRSWGYDSRQYLISRSDPETGTTLFGRDAAGNLVSRQVGSQPAAGYSYDAQNRLSTSWYNDGTEAACRRYDGNGNLTALNTGSIQRSQGFDANDNLTSETLVAYSRTLTLRHEYNANDAKSALVYPDNRRFDLIPDAFGRPTRLGDIVPTLQYNERSQLTYWQGANGRQDRTGYNVRGWPTSHQVRNNVTLPPVPVAPTVPAPVAAPGNPPNPPAQPNAPSVVEPGGVTADQACRAAYPKPTAERDIYQWQQIQYNPCVANWNAKGSEYLSGNGGCLVINPKPVCTLTRCDIDTKYQNALKAWTPTHEACKADWSYRATAWVNYRNAYALWQAQYQAYQQQLNDYNARNQAYQQYQSALAQYNQALVNYNQAQAAYNQALAASQPVLDSVWTYDGSGNVLTITDGVDASYNRSFGYDGLDRLTVANAATWGNGAISYDGNGNLTSQQFGNWRIDYGYDATQKLKTVSGGKNYSLSYDGWGNVTSRGDGLSYQYDAAGNLKWANRNTASQIAYTYDGAGTRVLSLGNGVNRLEFTGADGLLYQEINLATGATKDFLYHGRTKLADIEGTTTTWYHSDPAGSPMAGTDQNGVLAWRTHYRPYGEKMVGATDKNTQWFTGKPFEDKIGLSYYGARWYDPTLGRFMAMDPVDVESEESFTVLHSFSRYGYANNSPLKYIDPDGRASTLVAKLAEWKAKNEIRNLASKMGRDGDTKLNKAIDALASHVKQSFENDKYTSDFLQEIGVCENCKSSVPVVFGKEQIDVIINDFSKQDPKDAQIVEDAINTAIQKGKVVTYEQYKASQKKAEGKKTDTEKKNEGKSGDGEGKKGENRK